MIIAQICYSNIMQVNGHRIFESKKKHAHTNQIKYIDVLKHETTGLASKVLAHRYAYTLMPSLATVSMGRDT